MQTELNKEVKVKKEKIESPWTVAFKRLKKNKLALGGLFILLVLVLISILGPMLYPHDHLTIDLVRTNQPPSAQHWLGTYVRGKIFTFNRYSCGRNFYNYRNNFGDISRILWRIYR